MLGFTSERQILFIENRGIEINQSKSFLHATFDSVRSGPSTNFYYIIYIVNYLRNII